MFFGVETFAGTIDFFGNSLDIDANPGDGPAATAILFVPFGMAITPFRSCLRHRTLIQRDQKD
jgi:hypothetical protein